MLQLLKHLKKSTLALLTVIILLALQAYCDLSLPSYTSDIINVGIQQGGITEKVPKVIRKSEMDKIVLFLNESSKEEILSHFTLLTKDTMTEGKWNDYVKKYPILSTEPLYEWDKKEENKISKQLSMPVLMVLGFESDSEEMQPMKDSIMSNMPENVTGSNVDIFQLLTMMPQQARDQMIQSINENMSELPEVMLTQSSIAYTKGEYKAIGIDVDKIQTNYIIIAGAKMLGLALLATVASILVTLFAAIIAAKLGKNLRSKVFHKVLSFSNTEMDKFSTASLITRSTNDIQQVQMLLVMLIRFVIYSPIIAVGGIIKVLNTNSKMTWTLGVGVGAIFILVAILFTVAMPKFKVMQKLIDKINLVMREIITGLPVIRAFSTQEHEKERFDKSNNDLTRNNLFVSRAMVFMMPIMMLIMNLVAVLIVWVGAHGISNGDMQVGDMLAFIQYTMQIIISFLMLTMVSVMLPRATVSAKRIDEILTTENVIDEPKNAISFNNNQKGVVEFKNVSFRYPNAEEDVLSDINFTAKPGETTAIIGSTGSGKSTLINLIPRFYDVTGGSILVDGVDIRQVTQHNLREKLGFVPQKGVLFSGTIETNIKFNDSNTSDEQMKKAARIAQATEFIESKDEGYQTSIAQGGTNVSGGQKQRLSIARAIAKNPEIYIFDDSFSALDYKTDVLLRKALKDEIAGSTLLIVAQRISTIMNAEQIIVLDEGRIVGKGTHKELLTNCEVYQQIAASQLSKEELANE